VLRDVRVTAAVLAAVALGPWALGSVAAGCGGGQDGASDSGSADATDAPGGRPRAGEAVDRVVLDGLRGPTQFTDGPDGLLVVAELGGGSGEDAAAGDEESGEGRVLAVDLATGARRTLLSGLDKPTGVAVADSTLWVMTRRSLLRAPWPPGGSGELVAETVLDDLPYNGRSEGTLTPLPDGRILYETSGDLRSGEPVEGSGALWAFDPVTGRPSAVATGLKNAYAHAVLADGRVVTTDVGDNIPDPPPEELVVLSPPGPGEEAPDAGWPDCDGRRDCPGVAPPVALLPPRSTPTGVAPDPSGDAATVALFVEGRVVRVPLDGSARDDDGAVEVLAEGLDGPHTVLRRPDGELWVGEHLAGRIVALRD
jgi:glucose/arabinose dehydrogenase